MADIERLTIALPQPMATKIRAAVAEGDYASTSEVIRDAMRLWLDRRTLRGQELEFLRKAWDEGKESGVAGAFDMEAILKEVQAEKAGRQ